MSLQSFKTAVCVALHEHPEDHLLPPVLLLPALLLLALLLLVVHRSNSNKHWQSSTVIAVTVNGGTCTLVAAMAGAAIAAVSIMLMNSMMINSLATAQILVRLRRGAHTYRCCKGGGS